MLLVENVGVAPSGAMSASTMCKSMRFRRHRPRPSTLSAELVFVTGLGEFAAGVAIVGAPLATVVITLALSEPALAVIVVLPRKQS